jgi:hypothetical protein
MMTYRSDEDRKVEQPRPSLAELEDFTRWLGRLAGTVLPAGASVVFVAYQSVPDEDGGRFLAYGAAGDVEGAADVILQWAQRVREVADAQGEPPPPEGDR